MEPRVVIEVSKQGAKAVKLFAGTAEQEAASLKLYQRLRPALLLIDLLVAETATINGGPGPPVE
ncbi:MAG: hypothetical protein V3T23_12985 [Nitrososphaerales archaeon]